MKECGILFILIHIDEAHSSEWPVGLENQPEPQKNIQERIDRANNFIIDNNVPFPVYVDNWENDFAEIYQAWPDKYYHVGPDLVVINKSEYGTGVDNHPDALIKLDSLDLIKQLLEN